MDLHIVGTLILRGPTHLEVAQMKRWLENPDTVRYLNLEDPVFEDSEEYQPPCQEWIRAQLEEVRAVQESASDGSSSESRRVRLLSSVRPVKVVFAITSEIDRTLLGMMVFTISVLHQVGTMRIVIAPEWREKHIGRKATRLLLHYAFVELGLAKVIFHMVEDNVASLKVNKACGFRLEGVSREHALIAGGKRSNLLCFGILQKEYLEGIRCE